MLTGLHLDILPLLRPKREFGARASWGKGDRDDGGAAAAAGVLGGGMSSDG